MWNSSIIPNEYKVVQWMFFFYIKWRKRLFCFGVSLNKYLFHEILAYNNSKYT